MAFAPNAVLGLGEGARGNSIGGALLSDDQRQLAPLLATHGATIPVPSSLARRLGAVRSSAPGVV